MTERKYTLTERVMISGDNLTPKQADRFWIDLLELADLHRIKLHGTALMEIDTLELAPESNLELRQQDAHMTTLERTAAAPQLERDARDSKARRLLAQAQKVGDEAANLAARSGATLPAQADAYYAAFMAESARLNIGPKLTKES